jgi:predicted nucleotidyltransferase
MKIISWKDRYSERRKDAEDLLLIMHKYEQAGNFDRLYDEEQELLQEEDFDTRLAGIRLLGRDMAMMADNDAAIMVKNILDAETEKQSQYRLITDMIRGTQMFDGNFEAIYLQIEKLRTGFVEIAEKRY